MIQFTVPGIPQPRQAHAIGNGRVYLPKQSRDYQARVRSYGYEKMVELRLSPFRGAVELVVDFIFPAPMHLRKKQREIIERGDTLPYPSKDIDNCLKSCLDGLKGTVIEDDRFVISLFARKRMGKTPCTIVAVRPIETEEPQ